MGLLSEAFGCLECENGSTVAFSLASGLSLLNKTELFTTLQSWLGLSCLKYPMDPAQDGSTPPQVHLANCVLSHVCIVLTIPSIILLGHNTGLGGSRLEVIVSNSCAPCITGVKFIVPKPMLLVHLIFVAEVG